MIDHLEVGGNKEDFCAEGVVWAKGPEAGISIPEGKWRNRPNKPSEASFLLQPDWLWAGQAAGHCCTSRYVCISPSEPSTPVDSSAERGWVDREEEADIWLESAEPGDVCGAWGSCTMTRWIPTSKCCSAGIDQYYDWAFECHIHKFIHNVVGHQGPVRMFPFKCMCWYCVSYINDILYANIINIIVN